MPELGFQALSVFFLLLPGFLCVRLVQALCVRSKQTELDKIVEALLYSFLIYVTYALFFHSIPLALRVEHWGSADRYFIETDTKSLVLLAVFSIAWALLVAFLSNNDTAFSLLRKVSITQRTSRTSLWSDVFHTLGGYVQVELADGRSVLGWLKYYSDGPDEPSLFLEDAAWVNAGGEPVQIPGPGIMLTKDSGIRNIHFLRQEDSGD
jgi:hypothetical protein